MKKTSTEKVRARRTTGKGKDSPTASKVRESRDALVSRVIEAFPKSWLHPLLTGPDAVIGTYPFGCPDIEALLTAVQNDVVRAIRGKK